MRLEIHADARAVAAAAAQRVAEAAAAAVAERGRFLMAVSGGRTPGLMLEALAGLSLPWAEVQLFQVDERVAPAGHPARNLDGLRRALLERAPLQPEQVHAMPVEAADLAAAAAEYSAELRHHAGTPPVLDLVHLGLGADGHTASLLPGDVALVQRAEDVAVTGPYQGHRRMTLTFPVLDGARCVLWLVTGADKAAALRRLQAGDRSIPAGRVSRDRALVLADRAAASGAAGEGC